MVSPTKTASDDTYSGFAVPIMTQNTSVSGNVKKVNKTAYPGNGRFWVLCGCCKGWIQHLEAHNFVVKDVAVDDVNKFKQQFNVPAQAASCHTAMVDGVVIEGHVPAQDIKRLLTDKQDVRLLTVPAMPSGSPGMDFDGAPNDTFRVYAISKDDRVDVFQTYSDY